jgi:hypothetical protein
MLLAEGERPLGPQSRPRAENLISGLELPSLKEWHTLRANGLGSLSPAQRAGLRSVQDIFAPQRGALTNAGARPLLRNDLNVLPQRGQQPQQAVGGEIRKAAVEQCRDLRRVYAHESRDGHLGQPPTANDPPDVAGQLGLGELLLRLRETQIGEHVAAARRHRDVVLWFRFHYSYLGLLLYRLDKPLLVSKGFNGTGQSTTEECSPPLWVQSSRCVFQSSYKFREAAPKGLEFLGEVLLV